MDLSVNFSPSNPHNDTLDHLHSPLFTTSKKPPNSVHESNSTTHLQRSDERNISEGRNLSNFNDEPLTEHKPHTTTSLFADSPFSRFCQSNLATLGDVSPLIKIPVPTNRLQSGFQANTLSPSIPQQKKSGNPIVGGNPSHSYSPLVNSLAQKIFSKLEVKSAMMSSDADGYVMHLKAPKYSLNIDIAITKENDTRGGAAGPDIEDIPKIFRTARSELKTTTAQKKIVLGDINSLRSGGKYSYMGSEAKEEHTNERENDDETAGGIKGGAEALNLLDKRKRGTPPRVKAETCNCKKSRCLKLYCDCFSEGDVCRPECNCSNCANYKENEAERMAAMRAILDRNPQAFRPKFVGKNDTNSGSVAHPTREKYMKGCSCKKSNCMKKYCECFHAGIKCSDACKCESCHNILTMEKRKNTKHTRQIRQQYHEENEPDEEEEYVRNSRNKRRQMTPLQTATHNHN